MLRGAHRVRVEQHIPRMGDQRKVERAAKRARNSAILDQKVKALHDGSCDVLVAFDGSLVRGDPLACYKHARQDLAADRKANRLVESKMVEHLQEYRELHTSKVIDQLLPIVGEQHPFQRDDLSCAPTSLDHFECVHVFPDVQAMATKLLSYAMGSHHKFRFFLDYLEMDWSRKHQTIMHDQSPPITQPTDTGSLCSKARYCICSERGKLVKQLVARWSLAFKGSIVKFSGKPLVDGAHLVCRFTFSVPPTSVDDGVPSDQIDASDVVVWMHIAHVSWSPYMVVFHTLRFLRSDGDSTTLEAGHCTYCAAILCREFATSTHQYSKPPPRSSINSTKGLGLP
jgi:hypothetical protein